MKRTISIILALIITFITGSFALIPFNGWMWEIRGLDGGYDDEMKMFNILVFIEWPILIVLGGILGNWLYKKYLTKG